MILNSSIAMKFETYARDWFRKHDLIKSTKKTTRQALDVYILPVVGTKEITDVREEDVDAIFLQDRLVKSGLDFTERTFRVLNAVWDQLEGEGYKNAARISGNIKPNIDVVDLMAWRKY